MINPDHNTGIDEAMSTVKLYRADGTLVVPSPPDPDWLEWMLEEDEDVTENRFCPTGPGGGIDPTCGADASSVATVDFYHGTASHVRDAILKNGLIPQGSKGADAWIRRATGVSFEEDSEGHVFLTSKREKADDYVKMLTELHPGTKAVVLKVSVPADQVHRLEEDDNSAKASGAVKWLGKIDPAWITDITTNEVGTVFYVIVPVAERTDNRFCPTGPGGGIDPTCGAEVTTGKGESLHKVSRKDGVWVDVKGTPAPEHIQKLGIPPAWKDVTVNADPKGSLMAQGVDAKGRVQSKYSDSHAAKQTAAKFGRVTELRGKRAEIFAELERDAKDPELKDKAELLKLVMQTGMRPGSESDTGADYKSFGATTLEGRHVSADGSKLTLVTGKNKGREVEFPIHDKATRKMLVERAKAAGKGGRLFATNASSLRDYSKTKDGGGFKTKDHRTALGTETAIASMKGREAPTSAKAYKESVKAVAEDVAKTLGNTASVALKSYIDPTVFLAWRKHSGH